MIVRLSGGLGNQMFQYAFGLAAAQEWGEPLYIDTFAYLRDRARCYELSKLNVDAKKIGFIKQLKYNLNIFSKGCIEYEHTLFGTQNLNKNKERPVSDALKKCVYKPPKQTVICRNL